MTHLHVQVTLGAASGSAEDAVVNTFSVIPNPAWQGSALDLIDISGPISQIWTFPNTTGNPLGKFIGNQVSRVPGACVMKFYDVGNFLGGAPHGSPKAIDSFTMPAAFVDERSLPSEVAIVARIQTLLAPTFAVEAPDGADADLKVDRPRQRQTNRVYFGPFNISAAADQRPTLQINQIILAGLQNCQTILRSKGHTLAVWSRKDAQMRTAGTVVIDNAWDTQRRRGIRPSSVVTGPLA